MSGSRVALDSATDALSHVFPICSVDPSGTWALPRVAQQPPPGSGQDCGVVSWFCGAAAGSAIIVAPWPSLAATRLVAAYWPNSATLAVRVASLTLVVAVSDLTTGLPPVTATLGPTTTFP